jgi:hypothetical protein
MLEKWKKYQAKEIQSGKDENGNRLISLFAKDYKQVMRSEICPACNDFTVKYQNFIKKLETMTKVKNSGFSLKPIYDNITLHGSQKYFNNANLTDESALELLENHPKGEDLFATLPENLEELKNPKPIVPTTELVELFGKKFTVEQTKDLFKEAKIETKAASVKGFEDKFEKLTAEEKEALETLVNPKPIVPIVPSGELEVKDPIDVTPGPETPTV